MVRIQLDNAEFEGNNAIYLRGHEEGGPTTLIDTGAASGDIDQQLRVGLAAHGVSMADLDQVILTHHHADHAGLAGTIQAESGATVRVHRADAQLVERSDTDLAAYQATLEDRFQAWGMPSAQQTALERFFASSSVWADEPATVDPFDDGDRLRVGASTVEVVHLPGHAAGLAGLLDVRDGERVLYGGDTILPQYTPNVGGADVRVGEALATYIDSLTRLIGLDLDRVLPGHRQPIEAPAERTREILGHHRDRTARVVDVLGDHGPADAWTVSARLFGDLTGIHILHGPGEAAAHLDHLVAAGAVSRDSRTYVLADQGVDPATFVPIPGD